MERVEIVQYKAFDGTLFNTLNDCEEYERLAANKEVENFKQFPIAFPMQDQVTDCMVYLIHSESEFNALKRYMDSNFTEVWVDDIHYEGAGWYVLQDDHCGWCSVHKLTEIIHSWSVTLDGIAKHTMAFEEE
jgi:hypothetical protein